MRGLLFQGKVILERDFLDKGLEAACRENPGKSGLEPTAPNDGDLAESTKPVLLIS